MRRYNQMVVSACWWRTRTLAPGVARLFRRYRLVRYDITPADHGGSAKA